MPIAPISLPPQVATAMAALSSALTSQAAAATQLLQGGSGGAVNPGLGQVVDLSA